MFVHRLSHDLDKIHTTLDEKFISIEKKMNPVQGMGKKLKVKVENNEKSIKEESSRISKLEMRMEILEQKSKLEACRCTTAKQA